MRRPGLMSAIPHLAGPFPSTHATPILRMTAAQNPSNENPAGIPRLDAHRPAEAAALPYEERNDLELVSIVRDSEDQSLRGMAFRVLVDRYKQRIHALCYRMLRDTDDAEDAAQEAFVKAYRKIDTFRGESQFYTWLYRIASNVSNDYYEARKRRRLREPADIAIVEPVQMGDRSRPDRVAETEELKIVARHALEKVPPLFRTVLVLREYENLEYREIADTLGISVGTVMSRLFRARMRFKNAMEKLLPSLRKQSGDEHESE